MANEIGIQGSSYSGTSPLYFVAQLASASASTPGATFFIPAGSQFLNGTALESFNAAHWTQYANAMPVATDGNYYGNFPAVADGQFQVTVYVQQGSSPAQTDPVLTSGDFDWAPTPPALSAQLSTDAALFLSDFGEPITYNVWNSANGSFAGVTIQAVINRNPPVSVTEDGRSLVDNLEIAIANSPSLGRTAITPGRDTVAVPSVFGSTVISTKLVTQVVSGDQGMWVLRVK